MEFLIKHATRDYHLMIRKFIHFSGAGLGVGEEL
jgi:hypothetical protein